MDTVTDEVKLRNAGRIPYATLQGVVGAFFGVAVLTVAARMATKLHTRRALTLDDYFLLLSLACLTGAAILVLKFTRIIFIVEALELDRPLNTQFSSEDLSAALDAISVIDASWCLMWTATFFVKFSFLALFRLLIRRLSKTITIYYWSIVVLTGLTWPFMVSKPFIFCQKFGAEAIPCLSQVDKFLDLTIIATILDVGTDILIVSIPVLILRKSQMKLTQKLGLGGFFCLSMTMVLIALVRMSVYRRHGNQIDATWHVCWLYLEACVATMMASITAFRTLFVHGGSKQREIKAQNQAAMYSWREKVLRKIKSGRSDSWQDLSRGESLPKIPSATLTGIKSFINYNGRTRNATTMMGDEEDQLHTELVSTKNNEEINVSKSFEIHSERVSREKQPLGREPPPIQGSFP